MRRATSPIVIALFSLLALASGMVCANPSAAPDAISALLSEAKAQPASNTPKQEDALGHFMQENQLLGRLSDRASSLVNTSMGFLGMPYRLGGNGEQDTACGVAALQALADHLGASASVVVQADIKK